MAEYLEDFTSDPTGWTDEAGTRAHDAVNDELDISSTGGNYVIRADNPPGNLVHEQQCTFITNDANGSGFQGPCGCRLDSGFVTAYMLEFEPAADAGGSIYLLVNYYGTPTTLATYSYDVDVDQFWTARLAVEGGDGVDPAISIWFTNHGGSKPSDPGWIGDDGSPDETFTHTAGGNLLNVAADSPFCGIAGFENRGVDQRFDFFKSRLISDRPAGGGGRIMSSLTRHGGLAGVGGIAGPGGGLAG